MYKVYYWRPAFSLPMLLGDTSVIRVDDLGRTHVHVKDVEAENLEHVYQQMQGEVWSPNGEQRSLINSKGLTHTSMSMGDIVIDPHGFVHVVATFGFKKLCKQPGC